MRIVELYSVGRMYSFGILNFVVHVVTTEP